MSQQTTNPLDRLIRLPEVLQIIPVKKSTIWAWVKANKFPQPIKLGEKTTCWRMSDIKTFVDKSGV